MSGQTITRYVDLLVDLLLVRRLQPYHTKHWKTAGQIRPKTYVRDSGLVHALLGIADHNILAGHPIVGMSWEGFVIENLLARRHLSEQFQTFTVQAQVQRSTCYWNYPMGIFGALRLSTVLPPKLEKGFYHAREDLKLVRCFVVYSGKERYPLAEGVEAISLHETG